jgi:hypothetical protein
MQRAAASSPLASTPSRTPDHHAAKRQKLSNGAATPPSTGTSTPIPAADDLSPRLLWNAAGETQWVLNVPKPTSDNHNNTDSSSDEDPLWSSSRPIGRQSYGSFKRRKSNLSSTTTKNNPDDLSSLESGEEADTHPLRPMKRPKDREREEAEQGRRLDRIDLSRMGGVSGSSAMTGAGMGKRRDNGKGKTKNLNKMRDGKGSHKGPAGVHKMKKRKTM